MNTSPEGVDRTVPQFDPAAIPVINENVPVSSFKEDVVILSIDDDQSIHILSDVAKFVWEHIDGVATLQEILDDVLRAYDVEQATAANDLAELMDSLSRRRLVYFRS
jgi:hypothetical protein